MLKKTLIVLAIASALAACSNQTEKNSASAAAAKTDSDGKAASNAVKLVVAPEDIMKVESNELTSGPVITGSIQPERRADLRAEVQAIVLQVLKENGDVVKRGDVLVKLDETSIRDNLNSAEDATRNAELALDQSERALSRLKTLRASGMTSLQALDDAEVKMNAARSELSAARARAASARQQLQRTIVRAPFDGVVSDRKVSAGDTATLGKELVKVLDPTSMRFVGKVSTDRIALVKLGQTVAFRINGYTQDFTGKVTRVDPSANDITRQVDVLVAFADSNQPRVSGLYAEGNIESTTISALTLPEAAVVRAGDKSYAWRVKGNKLQKTDLALGKRDQRSGNYEIRNGIALGDMIMRNPNSSFQDGQSVDLVPAKVASAAATAGSK